MNRRKYGIPSPPRDTPIKRAKRPKKSKKSTAPILYDALAHLDDVDDAVDDDTGNADVVYFGYEEAAKCQRLVEQIANLTKSIRSPGILAGANKRMEDLVAYLQEGVQNVVAMTQQPQQYIRNSPAPISLFHTSAVSSPARRPGKRKRPQEQRVGNDVLTVSQGEIVRPDEGDRGAELGRLGGDPLVIQLDDAGQPRMREAAIINQVAQPQHVGAQQVVIPFQGLPVASSSGTAFPVQILHQQGSRTSHQMQRMVLHNIIQGKVLPHRSQIIQDVHVQIERLDRPQLQTILGFSFSWQ